MLFPMSIHFRYGYKQASNRALEFAMPPTKKAAKGARKAAGQRAAPQPQDLPLSWRQDFLRSGAAAIHGVCSTGAAKVYSFSRPTQNQPHVSLRPLGPGDFDLPEVVFSDITSQPRQFQATIMFDLGYRVRAGRYVAVIERHPRCPHRITDRAVLRLTYKRDTALQQALDLAERAYNRQSDSMFTEAERAQLSAFFEARRQQRRLDQFGVEEPY